MDVNMLVARPFRIRNPKSAHWVEIVAKESGRWLRSGLRWVTLDEMRGLR